MESILAWIRIPSWGLFYKLWIFYQRILSLPFPVSSNCKQHSDWGEILYQLLSAGTFSNLNLYIIFFNANIFSMSSYVCIQPFVYTGFCNLSTISSTCIPEPCEEKIDKDIPLRAECSKFSLIVHNDQLFISLLIIIQCVMKFL